MRPHGAVLAQLYRPAMGPDQFLRDGKAKPGAVAACRPLESGKEIVARLLRQARPSILDPDDCGRADSARRNREPFDGRVVARLVALHRLHGITAKIAQHAENLLRIDI